MMSEGDAIDRDVASLDSDRGRRGLQFLIQADDAHRLLERKAMTASIVNQTVRLVPACRRSSDQLFNLKQRGDGTPECWISAVPVQDGPLKRCRQHAETPEILLIQIQMDAKLRDETLSLRGVCGHHLKARSGDLAVKLLSDQ